MPLSQAAAAHQSGDLKQYLSLQCRLQILQPLGWEARLNSAATRIRLANDGDQKFQSVASFIARDLLSDSLPPQMVESDFRLYDGDSLRSKEFQGILPTWTRSRSSQDVGQGCSRSVSRSFARRVFADIWLQISNELSLSSRGMSSCRSGCDWRGGRSCIVGHFYAVVAN